MLALQTHSLRETPQTLCPECKGSLYVRYDLSPVKGIAHREKIAQQAAAAPWLGMWRYKSVLPRRHARHPRRRLDAPCSPAAIPLRLPERRRCEPDGLLQSARLGLAVTMAHHYGIKKIGIPSAGNAAGALAAYCAAAGIEAHIFMPKDVPYANYVEAVAYGANVTLVNGLIFRLWPHRRRTQQSRGLVRHLHLERTVPREGKKTMGYELVEQLGWEYPDAVFYPTGGGVGLIGMWNAFIEMEELGWVKPGKRPRMIAVQSSGCAPMVKAFDEHASASEMWPNAQTFASGLRVPKPYGDYIMLEILRESEGVALSHPGRRNSRVAARLVEKRRHLPRARRCCSHRRLRPPARLRLPEEIRSRRPLQHRRWPEVHRRHRRSHGPETPFVKLTSRNSRSLARRVRLLAPQHQAADTMSCTACFFRRKLRAHTIRQKINQSTAGTCSINRPAANRELARSRPTRSPFASVTYRPISRFPHRRLR